MYKSSNKSISKIISIFLICLLLFCAYSTNSFAATSYEYIPTQDFSVHMYTQEANQGGAITYYDNTIVTSTYTTNGILYYRFSNSNSNYYAQGNTKQVMLMRIQNFSLKDEYNLHFYFRNFANLNSNLEVYLTDGTNRISTLRYEYMSGNGDKLVDFNFTLSNLFLTTNQNIYLAIEVQYGSQIGYAFNCGFSAITLTDLDDDTGFFESIIQWIKNVVSSVTNGLTNLGNNISTWLTSLGNNISTWLTAVKDGIVNKLQSVQTAITNAIDGIQQWFVNLGNRIGEFFTMLKNYILYFQHPVTLNADGVPVDANGNPVYTNPFEDTLQSVSDTLDDWFDSLDDFILTIQSVNVQITGYLQTFTNIFNRFNAGVPIIGVIITLALIVIVIKKIMGR